MYAPSKRLADDHRETGSILILVLIVLSSMTALSVGLAYRTRIELKLAQAHAKRAQAHYLALGGIERAKALIGAVELSAETMPALCTFMAGAADEALFEQVPEFTATKGRALAYSLQDEQSYFNVNLSDPAAWENLGIFSRDHLSAILDWTDSDDDAGPGGAETDFYMRLPAPYAAKNAPCATLKELLLVKGTDQMPYRPAALGSDDASENGSRRPGRDRRARQVGLLDVFTVYGDGRLNANTASPMLLAALPGCDEAAVEALMAWRAGADGFLGTEDDQILQSAEDLAKIEGLTELHVELLTEYCCFESPLFRVISRACFDTHYTCCFVATIHNCPAGPQVLYLERLL
jgi:type II secretory pathway component PulK